MSAPLAVKEWCAAILIGLAINAAWFVPVLVYFPPTDHSGQHCTQKNLDKVLTLKAGTDHWTCTKWEPA